MRWVAFFLGFLTLAAGCVVEDKRVIPADGGVDAGDCGTCWTDRPICNEDQVCVECTENDDSYCQSISMVCDSEAETCVDCLGDLDCTSADAARCVAQECQPCNDNAQCDGVDGLPDDPNICDSGECVDCTPETEPDSCVNEKSCNPRTRKCTATAVGSRDTCQTCVADSECSETGNRCVAMTYQEQPFPDSETGFCLKTFASGDPCERPYLEPLLGRESLSGPPTANYCGIDEAEVACPAVFALLNDDECPMGEDGECPESGLCRDLGMGAADNRCTYRCGVPAQCPSDGPGSTCGSSGSGGSGGEDYCGG